MRIRAINSVMPTKIIDNHEVLSLIEYFSLDHFNGDIDKLKEIVRKKITLTGLKTRYWRGINEKPIVLIKKCAEELFEKTSILRSEIDVLIYIGIDRGFIEPANSNFICKEIGIKNTINFDIVDACMGWCTASFLAQSLFNTYDFKKILIVSSECPMDYNGVVFPQNFIVKNIEELEWKLPSYTLGEGVSMTILTQSKNQKWEYKWENDSHFSDLCTIPLYKHHEYSDDSSQPYIKNKMNFSAYGSVMSEKGIRKAISVFKELIKLQPNAKFVFPHSISERLSSFCAQKVEVPKQIISTFSIFGNLATSSIPSAIHKAVKNDLINEGDCCIGWVGSGGMKYSAFTIYF